MDKINVSGLVALGLVLAFGCGGGLGALALGYEEFATNWVSGTAGLLFGLIMPQVAPLRPSGSR